MLETMSAAWASIGGVDLVAYARRKILPDFSATYSDLVKRVAVMALTRIQEEAALAHATVSARFRATILSASAKRREGLRPRPVSPTIPKPGRQR